MKSEQYFYTTVRGNVTKINTVDIDVYHTLVKLLKENNFIGHNFSPRSVVTYGVVIKGIHPSIKKEEIKEELKKLGHEVVGEIITVRNRKTKKEIPVHFVNFARKENNSEIKHIQYLNNRKIKVESPYKKQGLVQCVRCQQYGHTRNNCFRPPRCVRCGEDHITADVSYLGLKT